jgi:hypothetical protein
MNRQSFVVIAQHAMRAAVASTAPRVSETPSG